ncbi:MAG: hypothetical protein QM485_03840 [Flavobacteriaceae bacterium]
MKNSKFTESQIIKALKENEQGRSVGDISRGLGKSTFYYWLAGVFLYNLFLHTNRPCSQNTYLS